jgi:hypothetical protein
LTLAEGSKKGRIQQRKDLIRKTMGGLGEKERTRRRVQKMADEYYKDQQKERKGKKRKGSNSSAV